MTAEQIIEFMKWQNRNAERLIRMSSYAIANEYLKKQGKKLPIHDVILCLSKEEKDLMIDGINSAIAICDWDNYQKEEYESPKAQISWYYGLIDKLNKA